MAVSSSKKGVQLLVSHFVQLGIKHIVFSPGSRNAPLVIAFNNHTFFRQSLFLMSGGMFYALGMAQQLNEPVALVCTSGSAVLNYYPAVAEAFYQNIPLIVLSADRPLDWIDQGDGQTIRQENVLKNHVRYYTALRENHHSNSDLLYNSREIATAFHQCNGTVKGPVHINFPFTEPLYGKEEFDNTLEQIKPTQIADNKQLIPNEELIRLKESWKNTAKIMVLVGQHQPNPQLLNALKALNNLPNVAIVAENTSNMIDRDFVNCIDRTLNGITENEQADFAPELLITLGGAIVSKKSNNISEPLNQKNIGKSGMNFHIWTPINR